MLTAGQYSVQKNGQIICINCVGVWTNYTARQMTQHAHQEIKSLCDEPWAMVFNTLQWELGTPDIWLPITKLMQWSAMKKQKRIAIVFKKRLHLIMLLRILEPITQIECQAFEDESKALEWLSDFLANENPQHKIQ